MGGKDGSVDRSLCLVSLHDLCRPMMVEQRKKYGNVGRGDYGEQALSRAKGGTLSLQGGTQGGTAGRVGEPSVCLTHAERCTKLAKYYIATISLFGEMCLDRSNHCINALSAQFPFELLVSCIMDAELPDILKAAFTGL